MSPLKLNHHHPGRGKQLVHSRNLLTSSGKKAKEKMYPVRGESAEKDDSTDHVAKKVLKCTPKCVVCCAISDLKDKEFVHQEEREEEIILF